MEMARHARRGGELPTLWFPPQADSIQLSYGRETSVYRISGCGGTPHDFCHPGHSTSSQERDAMEELLDDKK